MPELEYLSTLTPKQHQALTLLAEGHSITATAKACKLHRTTIHYWKRSSPEFAYTLHDAQIEQGDHWRAASNQRAEASLALIDTFLADPKIPASVRLKAALHILNAATATPKFDHAYEQDPYRAGNQLVAQMRADEAERIQFLRDRHEARNNDSSQFITSRQEEKQTTPQPEGKLVSSQFITSQDDEYKVATIRYAEPPTGRNAPCPCKSGKKYKHCCLNVPKAA